MCALAYLVGRRWTLYRSQVPSRLDSPAHWASLREWLLGSFRIREVMRATAVATVPETARLPEVVRTLARSRQSSLPVVDEAGRVTGSISGRQVQELLDRHSHTFAVIAHDLATPGLSVAPEEGLDVALARLDETDLDELPVVDPAQDTLLGLVSRRDILTAYTRRGLKDAGSDPHKGV